MTNRQSSVLTLVGALAIGLCAAVATTGATQPSTLLALASGRISIAGTSNIHPYTASTTDVRITRVQLANGASAWADVLKPAAIDAFEISIPAATLSSPKEGIDKTMHKALKVTEFPEIVFRLLRLEAAAGPGAYRGIGMLRIAGVEREIALDLKILQNESTLTVKGETQLLMTDYGITPPKAMLGMLKTDPKVTITFETALTLTHPPAATN